MVPRGDAGRNDSAGRHARGGDDAVAIVAAVIRRTLLALCAVAAMVALSSCSTFNRADSVAVAGGSTLHRDGLSQLLRNPIVQNALQNGELDGAQAELGSQADRIISIWIVLNVIDHSGAADLSGTAEQAALTTKYAADFTSASPTVQQLLTQYAAFVSQRQAGTLDQAKVSAAVTSAKVHVDSRYGRWDGAQASVVPFGSNA